MNNQSPLPNNWIWTTLGEAFSITFGQSPPSSVYNENGVGLPFFQGKAEFGDKYPTVKKWCSAPKKIAEKGDVLISIRAPVGPTNICPEKACIGRGLAAVRGLAGVQTSFILYLLRAYESKISKESTGTTFDAITGSRLKAIQIPLPPLAEQGRIVNKLEDLFTRISSGINQLLKSQIQLKLYKNSLIKSAFNGKLTQKWRSNFLEGEDDINRYFNEIKTGYYGSPLTENTPYDIPIGWLWVSLGDIVNLYSGKFLPKKIMNSEGKYPVYGGNGITGYHNQYLYEDSKLIIGRVGAKCGVVHITLPKSWVTDNAMIVDFKNLNIIYLKYVLEYLNLNRFSVSTAQPVISQKNIYPVYFPLPLKKEQEKIIEILDSNMSVIEKSVLNINNQIILVNNLRQMILKSAFIGNLIPQNKLDEPASILLEQIKKEK
jgi:type I restriction enzyme S subunit